MRVGQSHVGTGQVGAISISEVIQPRVEVRPGVGAKRISANWNGVSAEIVQFVGNGPFDYKFCAPVHLLIACERAVRSAGESKVGRSLKSSRHDFSGTLSLVPAGDEFRGTFVPRVWPRTAYIYIDPKALPADSEIDFAKLDLAPRLFFENAALWATARKLSGLVENPGTAGRLYAETLTRLLLLELLRLEQGSAALPHATRGGLAVWQVRRARDFIEDHLAEHVSLAKPQPHSFLPRLQALGRAPAAPISIASTHRVGKDVACRSRPLRDCDRARLRVQSSGQLLYCIP
jgi:AraC family transcriptional regulator